MLYGGSQIRFNHDGVSHSVKGCHGIAVKEQQLCKGEAYSVSATLEQNRALGVSTRIQ